MPLSEIADSTKELTGCADAPLVLHTRVVSGTGGGPEKTILNSPRYLVPHGYDSICAYMYPPDDSGFGALQQMAADAHAPLVGIKDRGAFDTRVVREMVDLCRSRRVAIWHGHDYKSNALGLLLRRWWPMKLVTTVHGWGKIGPRTRLYYAIDRFCLRYYEKVICVSSDLHDQCRLRAKDMSRYELIENAIDTERYARRRSPEAVKQRLGFANGRILIGAVGRLSEEKNFLGLIRAVKRLIEDGAKIDIAIAGDGDQREQLEAEVDRLKIADHVHLLGYRSDTLELYQAFDVFALSSLREGLPNVLLEAMALEVPVVATRIAGVPRLVKDGENGVLVEPGDEDELVRGLASLLADASLREQYAQAGRRTIEEDYSFERRMERVARIYNELLQTSPDNPR